MRSLPALYARCPVSNGSVSPRAVRDEDVGGLRMSPRGSNPSGDTDTPMQCGAVRWGLHDFISMHRWSAMPRSPSAVGAVRIHIERQLRVYTGRSDANANTDAAVYRCYLWWSVHYIVRTVAVSSSWGVQWSECAGVVRAVRDDGIR